MLHNVQYANAAVVAAAAQPQNALNTKTFMQIKVESIWMDRRTDGRLDQEHTTSVGTATTDNQIYKHIFSLELRFIFCWLVGGCWYFSKFNVDKDITSHWWMGGIWVNVCGWVCSALYESVIMLGLLFSKSCSTLQSVVASCCCSCYFICISQHQAKF